MKRGRPKSANPQTRVQVFVPDEILAILNEIAPLTGGMSGAIRFTLMTGAAAALERIRGGRRDLQKWNN